MSNDQCYALIDKIPCPYCKAEAGKNCHDLYGFPRSHHSERMEAVEVIVKEGRADAVLAKYHAAHSLFYIVRNHEH